MDGREFAEYLRHVLENYDDEYDDDENPIDSISSFEESGVLTMDEWLVVHLEDETKVYLTIQAY